MPNPVSIIGSQRNLFTLPSSWSDWMDLPTRDRVVAANSEAFSALRKGHLSLFPHVLFHRNDLQSILQDHPDYRSGESSCNLGLSVVRLQNKEEAGQDMLTLAAYTFSGKDNFGATLFISSESSDAVLQGKTLPGWSNKQLQIWRNHFVANTEEYAAPKEPYQPKSALTELVPWLESFPATKALRAYPDTFPSTGEPVKNFHAFFDQTTIEKVLTQKETAHLAFFPIVLYVVGGTDVTQAGHYVTYLVLALDNQKDILDTGPFLVSGSTYPRNWDWIDAGTALLEQRLSIPRSNPVPDQPVATKSLWRQFLNWLGL